MLSPIFKAHQQAVRTLCVVERMWESVAVFFLFQSPPASRSDAVCGEEFGKSAAVFFLSQSPPASRSDAVRGGECGKVPQSSSVRKAGRIAIAVVIAIVVVIANVVPEGLSLDW